MIFSYGSTSRLIQSKEKEMSLNQSTELLLMLLLWEGEKCLSKTHREENRLIKHGEQKKEILFKQCHLLVRCSILIAPEGN